MENYEDLDSDLNHSRIHKPKLEVIDDVLGIAQAPPRNQLVNSRLSTLEDNSSFKKKNM